MKIDIITYPDFTDTLKAMKLPMNGKSDIDYYEKTGNFVKYRSAS